MARGPLGTPATPAQGTHHGVVVAVHHQRPPSSQVDVLLPPVAHLRGDRAPASSAGAPWAGGAPGVQDGSQARVCMGDTHHGPRGSLSPSASSAHPRSRRLI